MAAMETLSEAIDRLVPAGYIHDFRAHRRRLLCDRCGVRFEPSATVVDEIVRFEGTSDPADQAILYALATERGPLGLYSAAYGTGTSIDDTAVANALPNRRPWNSGRVASQRRPGTRSARLAIVDASEETEAWLSRL